MARNFRDLQEGVSVGRDAAAPVASQGAADYARQMGRVRPNRFDNVLVNVPQAQRIAQDFIAAPEYDPAAEPHFRAMAEETKHQFDYMTRPRNRGGMGLSFEVSAGDPYTKPSIHPDSEYDAPDPAAMMRDVAENNRIKVLATRTTGSHPYFTDDENDMFRGVHDVFGHAATGRGFDAHGEEAAFRSHYAMYGPLARQAMAVETRGQNSTNNYGGLARGEYAPNKVITLPSTQLITPIGRRAAFAASLAQAKRAHERAFGPVNE